MSAKFGWFAVLTAFLFSVGAASAADNVIVFQNDSCVAIHLQGEGNDSCFGYRGCELQIAPRESKSVKLREGVKPKWARITVAGSCEEQEISLGGECAIDLEKAFRGAGYRQSETPYGSLDRQGSIFEEITGPIAAGTSTAKVRLSVGTCEEKDGFDKCEVRCTVN